jgi:hypothetical protein
MVASNLFLNSQNLYSGKRGQTKIGDHELMRLLANLLGGDITVGGFVNGISRLAYRGRQHLPKLSLSSTRRIFTSAPHRAERILTFLGIVRNASEKLGLAPLLSGVAVLTVNRISIRLIDDRLFNVPGINSIPVESK